MTFSVPLSLKRGTWRVSVRTVIDGSSSWHYYKAATWAKTVTVR